MATGTPKLRQRQGGLNRQTEEMPDASDETGDLKYAVDLAHGRMHTPVFELPGSPKRLYDEHCLMGPCI